MGCHSGKVSAPQSGTNVGSTEGTLLSPQNSPPKEAPLETTDVVEVIRNVVATVEAPATMIVTDCGQVYSTHQGLARALNVYDLGWVSKFNDVKNGDTGTLLGESNMPMDAVALRIHRNGGVVCIARKGVAFADFNGFWSSGEICGDKLTWSDGTVSHARIDEITRTLSVTFDGTSYTAELRDDNKIYWDDGDIWTRLEGPPPPPPLEEVPPHETERMAGQIAGVADDACSPRRLSSVQEESEQSSDQAGSPTQAHKELEFAPTSSSAHKAPEMSQAVSDSSPALAEPELAPAVAAVDTVPAQAAVTSNDSKDVDGKRARRERTMCCC